MPAALARQLPRAPGDNVVGAACDALPATSLELHGEVRLQLGHRQVGLEACLGVPGSAAAAAAAAPKGYALWRMQRRHSFGTFRPSMHPHLGKVADDLPVEPEPKIRLLRLSNRGRNHQHRAFIAVSKRSPDTHPAGHEPAAHSAELLERTPAMLGKHLFVGCHRLFRPALRVEHRLHECGSLPARMQRAAQQLRRRWQGKLESQRLGQPAQEQFGRGWAFRMGMGEQALSQVMQHLLVRPGLGGHLPLPQYGRVRIELNRQPKMCSPGGWVSRRTSSPRAKPATATAIKMAMNRRGAGTVASVAPSTLATTTDRPTKLTIQMRLNPLDAVVASCTIRFFGRTTCIQFDSAESTSTAAMSRVLMAIPGPCDAVSMAIGVYRKAAAVRTREDTTARMRGAALRAF